MELPDLSKLGAPEWFVTFFSGILVGCILVYGLYDNFQVPVLEKSLQESNQRAENLEAEIEQISRWNKEFKIQNEQLIVQRDVCLSRNSIVDYMNDLKNDYDYATKNVIEFTDGVCTSNSGNECDLNSLSQRKLKALEEKRDQLHAQMLDVQARLPR